ncbi:MAG: radical SAM protein [Desulfobulbaceae bacterium]|nr:MAG: radical SAM protein [Desulfobulbaceae bacterium]
MAQKGVEKFARMRGVSVITLEIIRAAKGEMEQGPAVKENKTATNLGDPNKETSRLHRQNSIYFARENVDPLRFAFTEKAAVHAGAGGEHLPADQVAATWQRLAGRPDQNRRRTAYVHIPFCRSHCRFCGFYMYGSRECISSEYTGALLAEMKQTATLEAVGQNPIHAVYFGGGTPSDLDAADLRRLLLGIRDVLPLANDCEVTVEGRVSGFDSKKITACLDGGANRFSIGVQSFNTMVRRKMGRVADREQALAMLADLTSRNSAATVIDLIYGFPEQSMEIWQEDVRTFLEETQLDGCDMYQLNVFRGGPLATAILEGKISPAADIPLQAEMFAYGRRAAMKVRMKRLSMNHWGWDGRERN